MSGTRPLISVIIPVYNAEAFVAEAIESALAQNHEALEIIAVDDGSVDSSAAAIQSFPSVRYIYQPNAGIGAARNSGIRQAQGDFLAFLDADDIWLPEKLASQMSAFEDDPNLDIVFTHVIQFISPGFDATSLGIGSINTDTPMPGHIPSTMLIQRDSFFRVGWFEANWKIGEFTGWYARSLELALKSKMLLDALVKRRIHDSNQGIRQHDSIHDYLHIIKATLERRRSAGQLEE